MDEENIALFSIIIVFPKRLWKIITIIEEWELRENLLFTRAKPLRKDLFVGAAGVACPKFSPFRTQSTFKQNCWVIISPFSQKVGTYNSSRKISWKTFIIIPFKFLRSDSFISSFLSVVGRAVENTNIGNSSICERVYIGFWGYVWPNL